MNKLIFLTPLLLLVMIGIAGASGPTLPSGIQSYVPINLTNSQSSATPSPFQQMINLTESNAIYGSYIAYSGSLANFEYFYANGTIIPAWIESNSSGKLITWANTIGIGASSKLTIYLGFASKTTNLLSSSGTSGIGEAPQLSSTYAEYDDGAEVFPYYQRWGGLSALPSGWSSNNTNITYASTYTSFYSSDGNSGNSGIYMPTTSAMQTFPLVFEYYGYQYTTSGFGNEFQLSQTAITGGGSEGGYGFTSTGSSSTLYLSEYNNGGLVSMGISDSQTPSVYTFSVISSTSESGMYNYQHLTTASPASSTPSYISFSDQNPSTYPIVIYWLRTRAYPPSGVMPTTSAGSLVDPGINTTTSVEMVYEF